MDDDAGSLAVRDEREMSPTDVARQRTEVEIRSVFDCSGTLWGRTKRTDGKSVCHRMPWTGAPDVMECGVRIEHFPTPGVPEIVKPDGAFSPDEVDESFLLALGGGRRYRLSLRFKGNTVRHSYLTFDLSGVADPIPFPHERAAKADAPAAPAAPAPAPTDGEAAAVLRLGADPVAALLGSAINGLADPGMKLAFALALDRGERAEALRREQMARDERLFTFMSGTIKGALSGGGDGSAVSLLREQNADLRRGLDEVRRDARDSEKRARDLELEAVRARAGGAAAPNPILLGIAQAIPAAAAKAVEMAGADAARAAVGAVASAAAAVG